MGNNVKEFIKTTFFYLLYLQMRSIEGRYFLVSKIKRNYKKKFGVEPNLKNPKSFSEKLQWLKLYYAKDKEAVLAGDKLGLHRYLDKKGLGALKTPIIKSYNHVNEINWEELPNKFVAKKSNACGFNLMITDKSQMSEKVFKRKMNIWMKTPYGYLSGEPHYEKMQPKIVVERFVEHIGEDYKIFCINGKPEMLQVSYWVKGDEKNKAGHDDVIAVLTDFSGKVIGFKNEESRKKSSFLLGEIIDLPDEMEEMLKYAKVLSEDFPLVRVDFYFDGNKLVLGELTLTPSNGLSAYTKEIQEKLGKKIRLPKKKLKKLCFAASSGGHFYQLMMLKPLMEKYDSIIVTEKTDYKSAPDHIKTYYLRQINRREKCYLIWMLANVFASLRILWKEKPDAIVCTGVLAVLPLCLWMKLFGKKVIFIESIACTKKPTQSGKLLYKFADYFYVQWQDMIKIYPKAIYLGGIY